MAKQGIRWFVLSDFKTVDKCSQKQLPLLEKHVYLFKKYNLKVHLLYRKVKGNILFFLKVEPDIDFTGVTVPFVA